MARPRFIVLQTPWPLADAPHYQVYDRHRGHFVVGRWSYRTDAQSHADECNAREEQQGCA